MTSAIAQNVQPVTPTPLRVYRVAMGLTQADLAELADVSRGTVVMLEARRARPHRATANALARVLGVDADVLFPLEADDPR